MKTVPFASLILAAPDPPLKGLNDAGGILDQPAFLPIEEDGSVSTYAPGILRILPFDGRARFFRYSDHKRRERYGMAGCVFLACIAFGLLGMGVLYFLFDPGCGEMLPPAYECSPPSILDDPQFRLQGAICAGGVLLYAAYCAVLWLDPHAGPSARVELPEDLKLGLYSDRIRAAKVATASMEKPKLSLGEKAGQFGMKKAAGWTGKLLMGPVGEVLSEATVETVLESDTEEKRLQKSELVRNLRKRSEARIADCHRHLTGREPVAIAAAEFTGRESFSLNGSAPKPVARKRRRAPRSASRPSAG